MEELYFLETGVLSALLNSVFTENYAVEVVVLVEFASESVSTNTLVSTNFTSNYASVTGVGGAYQWYYHLSTLRDNICNISNQTTSPDSNSIYALGTSGTPMRSMVQYIPR